MEGMRRPMQFGGEFWGSCRRTLDCGPGCIYAADTARAAAVLLEAGYMRIPRWAWVCRAGFADKRHSAQARGGYRVL